MDTLAKKFFKQLDEHIIDPLKYQGILNYFNGINLIQSKKCVTVNCHVDLKQVFERHIWTKMSNNVSRMAIPLTVDSKTLQTLETN